MLPGVVLGAQHLSALLPGRAGSCRDRAGRRSGTLPSRLARSAVTCCFSVPLSENECSGSGATVRKASYQEAEWLLQLTWEFLLGRLNLPFPRKALSPGPIQDRGALKNNLSISCNSSMKPMISLLLV